MLNSLMTLQHITPSFITVTQLARVSFGREADAGDANTTRGMKAHTHAHAHAHAQAHAPVIIDKDGHQAQPVCKADQCK